MILRETRICECWCESCSEGQMGQILDASFKNKQQFNELVGKKFTCKNCGHENTIEDFVSLIPGSFFVLSSNDASKAKSNDDLSRWLDKEEG